MTKSQERALNKIKRLAEKWANEGFKDGEKKDQRMLRDAKGLADWALRPWSFQIVISESIRG